MITKFFILFTSYAQIKQSIKEQGKGEEQAIKEQGKGERCWKYGKAYSKQKKKRNSHLIFHFFGYKNLKYVVVKWIFNFQQDSCQKGIRTEEPNQTCHLLALKRKDVMWSLQLPVLLTRKRRIDVWWSNFFGLILVYGCKIISIRLRFQLFLVYEPFCCHYCICSLNLFVNVYWKLFLVYGWDNVLV